MVGPCFNVTVNAEALSARCMYHKEMLWSIVTAQIQIVFPEVWQGHLARSFTTLLDHLTYYLKNVTLVCLADP
jgi:hypothetical protein